MTLTVQEIKDKIEQVTKDLAKIQSEPGNDRKSESLGLYIDYLKDELKDAERLNKGT
jgi:hypothetical protein